MARESRKGTAMPEWSDWFENTATGERARICREPRDDGSMLNELVVRSWHRRRAQFEGNQHQFLVSLIRTERKNAWNQE